MSSKASNKFIWILITFLVVIEQMIKIIINNNYLDYNKPIIKPWIYFKPIFNRDYSWYNSLFQLGIGKWVHIIAVAIIILIGLLIYLFIKKSLGTTKFIDITFAFLLSSGVCSLIDKVFWNGSLDYINLRGYFTFDLKDVYINIFIGLIILMFIINYKGLRKVDDKKFMKDFLKFILRKNN
ncbi:MAG: signal peptidase II [bacterium]